MEYNQFAKQMVQFQKMSFDNWYNAAAILQKQTLSAMNMMLDQSSWMPEESRQAVQHWTDACKHEGGRLKSYIDESFAGIEKYLSDTQSTAASKTKKQAS